MKKITLLMMLILSMVTFTGCFGPPAANAMVVSEEKIWPADIPSTVPRVKEEKIVKVTTLPNSILIELEKMTEADYTAYIEEVTAAGWEQLFESQPQAAAYKKGEARLDVSLIEGKMLIDYSKSVKSE